MMTVLLQKIAQVSAGQGAPQNENSFSDHGIPFIRAGNLEDLILTNDEYRSCELVDEEIAKEYKLKIYPKNTIVFAKSGMSATKERIYCLRNDSYVVNHLATITPDTDRVEPSYLKYYFKKFSPKKLIKDSAYPSIRLEDIKAIQIPLPSLEEQKRIVRELDAADALKQKRKQAIKLLDDYLKAMFLEMFGDPATNSKGWDEQFLEEMYVNKKEGTKCGPFGSALKKGEYKNNGVPVWTMDNIKGKEFVSKGCFYVTDKKYAELRKYSVKNGDIIISRAGTVGKMAIVQGNFDKSIISTNLIKLSLNPQKLLPLYFVSLMNYCKGRVGRLKTGGDGAFTHMNTGVLDSLKFPIPPIGMQEKFADIVQKTELLKQKMFIQAQELDVQFQSLIYGYFTQ